MEKEPQLNENDVIVFWMEKSRNRDTLKTCWYINIFSFNMFIISLVYNENKSLHDFWKRKRSIHSDGLCCQTRRELPNTSLKALWPQMSGMLPGCFWRMQVYSQTIFLLRMGCRSHPHQYHMVLTRKCSLLW